MTKLSKGHAPYEQRQIVAYCGKAGDFYEGGRRYIIWRLMSFYCGKGKAPIAAEFVRPADKDEHGLLHYDHLKEGEIVVVPGLIYRKLPAFPDHLMAIHMRAMKTFKPRVTVAYEKDTDTPAVDLGAIDLSGETKQ